MVVEFDYIDSIDARVPKLFDKFRALCRSGGALLMPTLYAIEFCQLARVTSL